MRAKQQSPSEHVSTYFHSKIKLCSDLKLSFEETKEQIVVGLHNRDLATMIAARYHSGEDAIFRDLLSMSRVIQERRERNQPRAKEANRARETKSEVTTGHSQVKLPARNAECQLLCFKCQKYGHVAKYCLLNTNTDIKPTREIHTSRPDNANHKSTPKAEIKVINNVSANLANKYMKKIKLDNLQYDALIDPGSSDCPIKATAVIRGKFHINYGTSELIGFGEKGNIVESPGTATANITVDGVIGEKN